jgi:hypothetical protein
VLDKEIQRHKRWLKSLATERFGKKDEDAA